jgi:tRNA threonylcarbamoyl adenosine modification protein YeaZ
MCWCLTKIAESIPDLNIASTPFSAFVMIQNPSPLTQTYGLGIDTTTATLTLLIGAQTGAHRHCAWYLERDLSSQLHPLLQSFMSPQQWADLAWIAVLKGPGSFTGTRIGVVTARTLAQQLNLPLFGWSNLAIAAYIAAQQTGAQDPIIAVSQPGQRGTVYGAIYQIQNLEQWVKVISPDQRFLQSEWDQLVASTPSIHQVIQTEAQEPIDAQPLAKAVLALGWLAWQKGERPLWSEVLPYYG